MPANKKADVPVSFTLKIGGAEAAGVFEMAKGLETARAMGNTKWGDIELKRGVATDRSLWNWRKLVIDGNLDAARKDCTVTMLDSAGEAVTTYSIVNAWPKEYSGAGLKADSNEVAVEGITLCHEGFEIQ